MASYVIRAIEGVAVDVGPTRAAVESMPGVTVDSVELHGGRLVVWVRADSAPNPPAGCEVKSVDSETFTIIE